MKMWFSKMFHCFFFSAQMVQHFRFCCCWLRCNHQYTSVWESESVFLKSNHIVSLTQEKCVVGMLDFWHFYIFDTSIFHFTSSSGGVSLAGTNMREITLMRFDVYCCRYFFKNKLIISLGSTIEVKWLYDIVL